MPEIDPFSRRETLLTLVKDMEKRWGLSLVSFLPQPTQECVALLQKEISRLAYTNAYPLDPSIELYGLPHLHCTHLTLARSNAWGPIMAQDFVKPGHHLIELFEIIQANTSEIPTINVKLNALRMSPDGLGLILVGRCADADGASANGRRRLLEKLNEDLPRAFNLSRRSRDRDRSRYDRLHCRLGFLKRPIEDYAVFAEEVRRIAFAPISVAIREVTLVHHRYRSLLGPSEGEFRFPLGLGIDEKVEGIDFARRLAVGE